MAHPRALVQPELSTHIRISAFLRLCHQVPGGTKRPLHLTETMVGAGYDAMQQNVSEHDSQINDPSFFQELRDGLAENYHI